jgi:hypothetical protein
MDQLMADGERMRSGDIEIIPGMRAQAAGVEKIYVDSDYAKPRSLPASPSSGWPWQRS